MKAEGRYEKDMEKARDRMEIERSGRRNIISVLDSYFLDKTESRNRKARRANKALYYPLGWLCGEIICPESGRSGFESRLDRGHIFLYSYYRSTTKSWTLMPEQKKSRKFIRNDKLIRPECRVKRSQHNLELESFRQLFLSHCFPFLGLVPICQLRGFENIFETSHSLVDSDSCVSIERQLKDTALPRSINLPGHSVSKIVGKTGRA
jgi:hypothetical protein